MMLARITRTVLTSNVKNISRSKYQIPFPHVPVVNVLATRKFSSYHCREATQFDNDTLTVLALEGNEDAVQERLIREIMAKDEVEWDDASKKFGEIEQAHRNGLAMAKLPYKVGIVCAVTAAFASFPLCFDLPTALWFNEHYVTTDVADPEDLETWLEVGTWTWNWMEPPLGQLSFFLLCLQYTRSQMERIGKKPFTTWLIKRRATALSAQYPQYHRTIVEDFSRSSGLN
eukprot:CAMPEP_0114340604 /NCGR_PEP_ID=MMETSP0101-20121206/8480_1 /TAXON_ID=38822 ORGANISM="Pteridomonas danica, Strain PT" /NCGR_SAMPLE_ID=MMETSP0101 /ASSEMBLY_ACC=CAM_ASM_000211 /LENGTH=229 /DNA_ID=CAMNT_0001473907 /DNA_START=23 /DNA_END=712 /DNA_ORIENTATION=-